ncbi:Dabb family protein [Mycolicibacterium sp. P9-22]|uniref:Dabb family protein n=1 Tax=Mycolicibacterium sp. P9-22 TaxID=2024613 RepID=UPI0011EDA926|nr:Dabb family protein [Mycolicibacterium sp. P9-22]KAA0113961.1 Dabb family protein [Mycolicibacterium sp. P9-22]
MIVSAQRFRFKADVTEEQKSHAIAAITAVSRLESVAFAVVGQDLGDPDEGFTHGYLVGIPDLDALERYFRDPVHDAGDRVFLPLLEKVTGIGISDDTDPDLRDRVVALHTARIQRDPEYAELLDAIPQSALLHEDH